MESEDSGSRGSEGSIYQESADTVLKTEEGGERPNFPAKNSIAQENAESKENSEPVILWIHCSTCWMVQFVCPG